MCRVPPFEAAKAGAVALAVIGVCIGERVALSEQVVSPQYTEVRRRSLIFAIADGHAVVRRLKRQVLH